MIVIGVTSSFFDCVRLRAYLTGSYPRSASLRARILYTTGLQQPGMTSFANHQRLSQPVAMAKFFFRSVGSANLYEKGQVSIPVPPAIHSVYSDRSSCCLVTWGILATSSWKSRGIGYASSFSVGNHAQSEDFKVKSSPAILYWILDSGQWPENRRCDPIGLLPPLRISKM